MAWRRKLRLGLCRATTICAVAAVALMLTLGCSRKAPPARKTPPRKPAATANKTPQESPQKAPARSETEQVAAAATTPVDRGEQLYAQHCLACHGAKGDGKGLAAAFVFPKPRDFRAGRFRLISTTNNIPSLADIEQVLVRGMPGSAMIPWAHLSEADRKLLSEYVLKLRRDGARDVELAIAKENEETLSEEDLAAAVARMTTAAEQLPPPEAKPASPDAIARGRELFKAKGCASCHGEQGKGDGQQKMVDNEGLPTRPRDLTRGIFKGSPDFNSVYRRIWLGMPGSAMPGSQNLTPEQVIDMAHFVLSLSDPPTRDAAVLKRVKINVARTSSLPTSLADESWDTAETARLTMTPLWWRNDDNPDLQVQGLHDGATIAVRLSWNDPEPNLHALRSEQFEDAVALELYQGPAEPFVGMGARGSPVDVWMWDADRLERADVEDANPRIVVDNYPITESVVSSPEFDRPGTRTDEQAKVTITALAAGNPIVPSSGPAATSLEGAGPGTVTFRIPRSQLVQSQAQWRDGRWHVMLSRAMQVPDGEAGLTLSPGARVSAAFAIWNGSRNDRDGQKLITIWQDLQLEE